MLILARRRKFGKLHDKKSSNFSKDFCLGNFYFGKIFLNLLWSNEDTLSLVLVDN